MPLKSIIAQIPNATRPARIINPVHESARPRALRPQNTRSKMQNKMAPKPHIPKAILTFANSDLTPCRCEIATESIDYSSDTAAKSEPSYWANSVLAS